MSLILSKYRFFVEIMARKLIRIMVSFAILSSCRQCLSDEAIKLSKADIDIKLALLKPLPKIHYYWPVRNDLSQKRLYELVRITHSSCISGEWTTLKQVDKCVYTCARLNKTLPKTKASIAINFSPWHRKFDKNLPPTDRGPTYFEEINYFELRAKLVKNWIAKCNEKYQSDVKVGALTLDCERFHEKPGNKSWNDGIRGALDAIHKKATSIFPGSRIEWYGRGIKRDRSKSGWSKTPYFTSKEINAPLSCSLYTVPELNTMRETYRRTCELANTLNIESVTPWVALASGYRRNIIKFQKWDFDWDYDLIYSWILGAELNIDWYSQHPERYAPYNRSQVVIFYPPPFDSRSPSWAKHFIAYVRGATEVKDLQDLGYHEK